MSAIILVGDRGLKNGFIERYLKENDIPSYNVFEYHDALKIIDARAIKKILGKGSGGQKRIFIFYSEPTLVAQSAMLKLLEELPDDSTLLFSEVRELLPTIISRCQIINVGDAISGSHKDLDIDSLVEELLLSENIVLAILVASDRLFSGKIENFEEIVLSIREILQGAIFENDYRTSIIAFRIIKALNSFYPTIYNNNLNKRIVFERLLISEFASPSSS